MRYLWNDEETFNMSLTLIFSAIHFGSQGSNDKQKMRSTLNMIMINFLNFSEKDFTFMKRNGNKIADESWEDSKFDSFTSKDYYD
jgi:hypothetical protein